MSATAENSTTPEPLFDRILCVTDLSDGGAEAVRQAAVLAGPGRAIDLMSVAPRRLPGQPHPQAEQIEALVAGTGLAVERDVSSALHIVEASDEPTGVLERSADRDLVVMAAGDAGLEVLRRTSASVLLARTPPEGAPFPESILVAVDGSPESHAAARLAAGLAVQQDAIVTLVATPEHDASHQHALEHDVQTVERITGTRPVILDEYRGAGASIVYAAASVEASVIVLGRRPTHPGGSVSAEVASTAPCSVLVVRAG
jgi:nucleotide-binding universal stress UspA family protein